MSKIDDVRRFLVKTIQLFKVQYNSFSKNAVKRKDIPYYKQIL